MPRRCNRWGIWRSSVSGRLRRGTPGPVTGAGSTCARASPGCTGQDLAEVADRPEVLACAASRSIVVRLDRPEPAGSTSIWSLDSPLRQPRGGGGARTGLPVWRCCSPPLAMWCPGRARRSSARRRRRRSLRGEAHELRPLHRRCGPGRRRSMRTDGGPRVTGGDGVTAYLSAAQCHRVRSGRGGGRLRTRIPRAWTMSYRCRACAKPARRPCGGSVA